MGSQKTMRRQTKLKKQQVSPLAHRNSLTLISSEQNVWLSTISQWLTSEKAATTFIMGWQTVSKRGKGCSIKNGKNLQPSIWTGFSCTRGHKDRVEKIIRYVSAWHICRDFFTTQMSIKEVQIYKLYGWTYCFLPKLKSWSFNVSQRYRKFSCDNYSNFMTKRHTRL